MLSLTSIFYICQLYQYFEIKWFHGNHFVIKLQGEQTVNCAFIGQETPGVTGKFGLGVENEAGQRLKEFCQEKALVIANILFQQHKRRLYTWTSPMVNTKIRLIIFFAAKDGEALYSRQNQDQELTVAQIMNSLLPNSDLYWRKWGKPLDHSCMT